MRVVGGLDAIEAASSPAFVVVGVFDGLHRGHAYLLEHLVAEAGRRGARPVVITFDHHPDEVLTGSAPPILCDPDERIERLEAAGVDTTVIVHFDRALRETPYDAFVARIAARDAPRRLPDDAGRGVRLPAGAARPRRSPSSAPHAASRWSSCPAFEVDGRAVSSTPIRAAIAGGRPRRRPRGCSAGRTRWWGRPESGGGRGERAPVPAPRRPALRKADTGVRVGGTGSWPMAPGRGARPIVADGALTLPGDRRDGPHAGGVHRPPLIGAG